MEENGNIIIYQTEDGLTKLDVQLHDETVWLSLDMMAQLFQRDKSTISRHIKNIFAEGELQTSAVVANFATTASDGKTYQVDYYNLDAIISMGMRCIAKLKRFYMTSIKRLKNYKRNNQTRKNLQKKLYLCGVKLVIKE